MRAAACSPSPTAWAASLAEIIENATIGNLA